MYSSEFYCNIPIDVFGTNSRGHKKVISHAYSCHASGDQCYPDFNLHPEVEKWLDENIGPKNYSLSSHATDAYVGLWATIYFRNREDAILFSITWA